MHSLKDEKDLVIVAIISAAFIVTTLSSNIGTIYGIFALAFAVYLNQNRAKFIEFSRGVMGVSGKAVFYGFALIGLFLIFGAIILGSQEIVIQAVTLRASSFLANFTIDNPLIKLIVYGFFIPVVETLFFYNTVFPFILEKARARNSLSDMNTLVSIAMIAGIATSFHFVVRLLNDQSLLTDLVFFGLSGAVVIAQKESSGAALGHVGANGFSMLRILGYIR